MNGLCSELVENDRYISDRKPEKLKITLDGDG
jgi:hypothetical protein